MNKNFLSTMCAVILIIAVIFPVIVTGNNMDMKMLSSFPEVRQALMENPALEKELQELLKTHSVNELLHFNSDGVPFPFDVHDAERFSIQRNVPKRQKNYNSYSYYGVVYRSTDGGQNWQPITPQNEEWEWNYVHDIEIDANGDILIVGDGVYKTDPDNINWIRCGDNWGYSLISDQTNANNIWVGTHNDLYESINGGDNWNSLGLSANTDAYPFGIYDLILKSVSPTNILCSTRGKGVLNYDNGIWNIGNGPYGGIVNKLVMHPDNHDQLFACTYLGGLFQSNDGASTWSYHSNGDAYWLNDLDFAPSNHDIVYLLGNYHLSYSINGGNDWTSTNLSDYYSGWHSAQIVVHPNDPGVILICGVFYDQSWNYWNGIIKSSDYGLTWEEVYKLEVAYYSYFNNFVVDPFNDNHIIAGGYFYDNDWNRYNIMVESYDWGISWNEITLPVDYELCLFNYSPHESQTLIVGFWNGELYKSQDNGTNWELIYSGNSGQTIEWDLTYKQTLYMGTYSGIMKSTDGGYNWEEISLEELNTAEVTSIVQNPDNPDVMYAGSRDGYGVFKSYDRGNTWQPAVDGFYNTWFYYNGLAQDPANVNILYAATYYNGLFKSIDDGGSWEKLPESPGSDYDYYAVKVSESNSSTIYASGYRRFHKSNDAGQTWETYNFDTNVRPYDIETHSSLSNQIFMAGRSYNSDLGKYLPALISSNDNGYSWEINYIATSLDYGYLFDLEIDPHNPSIFYACGYFRTESGVPDIEVSSDSVIFEQSFVGFTDTLELIVTNTGDATLTVSDITVDNSIFSVTPTSFSLAYGQEQVVYVSYTPTSLGTDNGSLTIYSNDPDESEIAVYLLGVCVEPPDIEVSPLELSTALFTGDVDSSHVITISNNGYSNLLFKIYIEEVQPTIKTETKNDESISNGIKKLAYQSKVENHPNINNVELNKGEKDTRVYPPMDKNSGGSDKYGYSWKDSNEPGGPIFDWIDVSSGISIDLSDDDYEIGIPLGFVFNYYGEDYETVNVMSNGWISFNDYDSWYPTTVPYEDEYDGVIAPMARDLEPLYGNHVNYKTFGTAPNRYFVVEFDSIPDYGPNPPYKTFEIILYEKSGSIKFQYLSVGDDDPYGFGIESPDETMGMGNGGSDDLFISPELVEDEYAIEFSSQISWLSVSEESGIILPSQSANITVTFDAIGMYGGDYYADININSNDPNNPTETVNAHLNVTGVPNISVSTDTLDFDIAYVGYSDTLELIVSNSGTDILNVSNLTIANPEFNASPVSFSLNPEEQQIVSVAYTPGSVGMDFGILTIYSNAHNDPDLEVVLLGEGAYPPDINVSPSELSADLLTGEIDSQTVIIYNNGQSNLEWEIYITESGKGSFEILPLVIGNYWTYLNKDSSDGYLDEWINTDSIAGIIEYNENEYHYLYDDDWDKMSTKIPLLFSNDSKKGNRDEYWHGWRIGVNGDFFEAYYGEDDGDVYFQENKMMIGNPEIGATWDATGESDYLVIVGIEDIYTEAGNFQNCWKVEYTIDDGYADWYWKFGVGLIRFEYHLFEENEHYIRSLIDYSFRTTWLSANPQSGTLSIGENINIKVIFDATDLSSGDYSANIVVASNDPDEPEVVVLATCTIAADFSSPFLLSDSELPAYSPNLIHVSGDSILVVYSQNRYLTTKLSVNGGETWQSAIRSDNYCRYAPSAFIDNAGIVHVYYCYGDELRHTTSSDYGESWESYENVYVFNNAPASYSLEANLAVDGSVWFNYYSDISNSGYILQRYAGGSFGEEISLVSPIYDRSLSGSICSLPNGNLMLVYQAEFEGNSKILRRYSYDNGLNWTSDEILFSDLADYYSPYLYIDNSNTVWIMVSSNRGEHFGFNLWYSKSWNNGQNWDGLTQFTDYAGMDSYPSLLDLSSRMLIAWRSDYRFGQTGIWFGDLYETSDNSAPPCSYGLSISPGYVIYEPQTVTAYAVDEEALISVELLYSINGVPQSSITMYDNGSHSDEFPNDDIYTTQIGPFLAQVDVSMQVVLTDLDENSVLFPIYPYSTTIYDVQNAGNLWTVYKNNGEIGDANQFAPSMEWPGGSGNKYLYQGGFWVGAKLGNTPIVDAQLYNDSDWKATSALEASTNISDKDLHIRYSDQYANNRLGVEVDQTGYSWSNEPNRDFIILDYTIYNTGLIGNLDDVYFGLWSDFDISNFPGALVSHIDDTLSFDYSRNLIYMFDGDNPDIPGDDIGEPDSLGVLQSPGYIGNSLLYSDGGNVQFSWWDWQHDPDFYNDYDLFQYLSNPQTTDNPDSVFDYRTFLSVGPMNIPAYESIRVVVGYVIGYGLEQLLQNTDQMQLIFDNLLLFVTQNQETVPVKYSLSQNYPNPFNPETRIEYQLPKDGRVHLAIYNINGQLVKTLINENQVAGYYSVQWDASGFSSGIYFYRIQSGEFSDIKKCIIVK